MRRRVASRAKTVLALLVGLAGCRAAAPVQSAAAPAPPPRVLIAVIVDQLSAWEAAERVPQLPASGGFARLRREGLWVRELRYEHAATDTAPGHAALFAGAPPRVTGIFANEAIGPDGKRRSILLDEGTRLVSARGKPLDRPGSSLARLRAETLANVLVTARPGARVFSYSLKDRGALFGAGDAPVATAWLDVPSEQFVTSTAFPRLPEWLAPLGDHAAVARAMAQGWRLSDVDRTWVAAHAETADDAPGEGDLVGLGRVFPHAITSAKAMRATPAGDRLLFAMAYATIDRIAKQPSDAPALLALSLSSHDYIAHVFGPHSWEAWTGLLELDWQLGKLMAYADRAFGPDGWALMLTADHGGGALPEVSPDVAQTRCAPKSVQLQPSHGCGERRRIMPDAVLKAVEAAADKSLGPGPWVLGFADPYVYLTPRGKQLDSDARAKLHAAVEEALRPLPIYKVCDVRALADTCSGPGLEALVRVSVVADGPGDFYLLTRPGAFFDPDVVPGFGENHGSAGVQDRAVPLFVRAPGHVREDAVENIPRSYATFTLTAATLLGIRAPASMDAAADDLTRVLTAKEKLAEKRAR
jgi:hypothetical protein